MYLEAVSVNHIISPYKRNRWLLGFKNNTDPSERERAGTLGAKSTVCFILRKQERTNELRNKERPGGPRRTTVVMIGGSSPFHNIQPREEHSPGDRPGRPRRTTVMMIGGSSLFHNIQPREEDRRIYNQEKTSPEQIQGLHHKID